MNKTSSAFKLSLILLLTVLSSCNDYRIATNAMEGTLLVGEEISYEKATTANKNEVIVFDYKGEPWVQRVVAKSGDEVLIKNGALFVNHVKVELPKKAHVEYVIKTSETLNLANYGTLNIIPTTGRPNFEYSAFLNQDQVDIVKVNPTVKVIEAVVIDSTYKDKYIINGDLNTNWNADFFGPLTIPKVGEKVKITPQNSKLYDLLGLNAVNEFVVKEPLYFLMGDNRHNSLDSRYIGFIPESLILGKVDVRFR